MYFSRRPIQRNSQASATLFILAAFVAGLAAADEPLVWKFDAGHKSRGFAANSSTLPAVQKRAPTFGAARLGGGLITRFADDGLLVLPSIREKMKRLPAKEFSVAAWVSIDVPQPWGGILSCVQDNGDYEKGWVLGYNERAFTFGLSTTGADDGDGKLTYHRASAHYELGKWHHVVATYDGRETRIYVDGQLADVGTDQSGTILYDERAPLVIGQYRDDNELHPHEGRLLEVSLVPRVFSADEVAERFARLRHLRELPPWTIRYDDWVVKPFLTWPTHDAISVMFETSTATSARVDSWSETGSARRSVDSEAPTHLHECRITGLAPNEKYFYQISVEEAGNPARTSDVLSFRTAATADRPFTFVAIGDTQSQPEVVRRISDLAYMHRPNFVLHAGDLVTTGTNKQHWTGHFFPNMQPLISRTPLMPVLGNHEQDADHYYKYMSLPEPESYYAFAYGNAEFFMIDGNRSLDQGSHQIAWLAGALDNSSALWKFAVLHQPPYTSDSNDYGDTFKTSSHRGDPNVRQIIALLEKHQIDICFSGHVHDYERTFPILNERVRTYDEGGVIYVTTAGGGGHLENFDPANTWFGHKKVQCHHLVYVAVNANHLEFQAVDQHGHLFDVFNLRKGPTGERKLDALASGRD